nr:immunoglobulin light chain junction region [Macaca mulatta]
DYYCLVWDSGSTCGVF